MPLFLSLLLVLTVSPVLLAQSGPPITADVPFAFEMANKTLAAGSYELYNAGSGAPLTVRNFASNDAAIVMTNTENYSHTAERTVRLVFNKYGDRHFLAEIWYPELGRKVMKSRNEKALVTSKLIAATPERVVILARLR